MEDELDSAKEKSVLYRMVQNWITHFRMHFRLFCTPRKSRCHAISKPVQCQWIGGLCSVCMDRQHFYVLGITWPVVSLDLTVPDFFLWGYLKECVYRNHRHHTETEVCYLGWDCDHKSRAVVQSFLTVL